MLDGYDDQDHDDWSNIDERSRSKLPAAAHPAYAGQTGLDDLFIAVNPYNPCLPEPELAQLLAARALHEPVGTVRRQRRSVATRRTRLTKNTGGS